MASSTIYAYLASWRNPKKGGPTEGKNRYRFFRPGIAWSLDFCHVQAGGLNASLLAVLDDCTRRIVAWDLMPVRTAAAVLGVLQQALTVEVLRDQIACVLGS